MAKFASTLPDKRCVLCGETGPARHWVPPAVGKLGYYTCQKR